jgi:hypothetical protein
MAAVWDTELLVCRVAVRPLLSRWQDRELENGDGFKGKEILTVFTEKL